MGKHRSSVQDRSSRKVRFKSALKGAVWSINIPNRYFPNSDFGHTNMIGGRSLVSADISLFKRYRFAKSRAHVYFKCFTNHDKKYIGNRDRHKFLTYVALKNVNRTNSKASSRLQIASIEGLPRFLLQQFCHAAIHIDGATSD